jgi:hypothetical protein
MDTSCGQSELEGYYPDTMADDTAWLPSALEPVAFRLARADAAAFEIGELALTWSGQANGALSLTERESEGGRVDVVVEGIRSPAPGHPAEA